MLASIQVGVLIIGVFVWLVSAILIATVFEKLVIKKIAQFETLNPWYSPLLLFTTTMLVIIMRGGFQTIPINQSTVYVFDEMYANHAAVNFAWNLSHSIRSKSYDKRNPFVKLDREEARKIVKDSRSTLIANRRDGHHDIL
jgi:hypothetical protein